MRPKWAVLLAVGVALLVVVALGVVQLVLHPIQAVGPTAAAPAAHSVQAPKKHDIVFILMDDFSLELLETMPHAELMQAQGATYVNSFVIDSLCCPSRAALLTGQTPHQTHVLTNTENDPAHPVGGWSAYKTYGNLPKQFSLSLQKAGYTTGFIGKYINGYEATTGADGRAVPPPKVPGWDVWHPILGGGYAGWGFNAVTLDGHGRTKLVPYPKKPFSAPAAEKDKVYATNVASDLAARFIARHKHSAKPYFLEIATYGPHSRLGAAYSQVKTWFPPAFADQAPTGDPTGGNCGLLRCSQLTTKDLVGFDDPREDNAPTYLHPDGTTSPAPPWRTNRITMTAALAESQLRDRARMVQSIDRMIARVRKAVGKDTYVVLTADNGFHLGQFQLNGGKGTPYDADTRVPLIVSGPGIKPGVRDQYVNNIDLAPTFESLAGARPGPWVSGRSFAPSLFRPKAPGDRYAFFEHTYAKSMPGEVDSDSGSGGTIDIIPSYIAVRSKEGLLVRFDLDKTWSGTRYAWELYNYADAPFEKTNVFARDHDKPYARDLMRHLLEYDHCKPAQCRAAAR